VEIIEPQTEAKPKNKKFSRIHWLVLILTICGIALFAYFVYSVGIDPIFQGVAAIGFDGFLLILVLYFLRLVVRAFAWKLSVEAPYELSLREAIPAVIIGEALSSMISLGILISGASKAIAVRRKLPLMIGLSSVAIENLFYSFFTGVFLSVGAIAFVESFHLSEKWVLTINILVLIIFLVLTLVLAMVIRQWHWASGACEWFYRKGMLRKVLETGRTKVRTFEDLVYGFYRKNPRRMLPICALQVAFHLLGVAEVFFILSRVGETSATWFSAFLLESVSRLITVIFKLVPFLIGVDEAGAQFITKTLALGAGLGVTIAIIRKGRILFWTAIGMAYIVRRGLTFKELGDVRNEIGSH
jgi:hypothetical protein